MGVHDVDAPPSEIPCHGHHCCRAESVALAESNHFDSALLRTPCQRGSLSKARDMDIVSPGLQRNRKVHCRRLGSSDRKTIYDFSNSQDGNGSLSTADDRTH